MIMTNTAKHCQEILMKQCASPHVSKGGALNVEILDGNDADIWIDLFFDHILDRHQSAGQRAWAASAGAFITDPERRVLEFEHLEPASIARQIRTNSLVEKVVYLCEFWVVACRDSYRAADYCSSGPATVTVAHFNTFCSPDRHGKSRKQLIPFGVIRLFDREHLVHIEHGHDLADVEQRFRKRIVGTRFSRLERVRSPVRHRLLQNELYRVRVWRFLYVSDLWHYNSKCFDAKSLHFSKHYIVFTVGFLERQRAKRQRLRTNNAAALM